MKKFFCNISAYWVAFSITMGLVLFAEAWYFGFIGFGTFLAAVVSILALVAGVMYGLYRLIEWLQSKCLKS